MFGQEEGEGTNWMDIVTAGLGLGTAIAVAVGGQPTTPEGTTYQPGYQQPMPTYMAPKPAISSSTILLLGGAAVAVLFLMKK
jgi:hypothetical protein